jgi:hypothetical protein
MVIDDSDGGYLRSKDGAASATETVQDARDMASRSRVVEKDEAFTLELSGIGNRMERFGVGENSKAARVEAVRRSETNYCFYSAAIAMAYAQPVTFRLGGLDVSMSLGDMRKIAQERYDHYAAKSRGSGATLKDRERMDAFERLMRLTDDVAAGKASPEELAAYIEEHGLGQELVDAAKNEPSVKVTVEESKAEETARAGAYADQSAQDLNASILGSTYGTP